MSASRESVDAYVQRLAEAWIASRVKFSKEGGWKLQMKHWREGDLWFESEPGFIKVFGHRDALICRGVCAACDFPQGRKRHSYSPDDDSGIDWLLERRARDVYQLSLRWGDRDGTCALQGHRAAVARRRVESARSADPGYQRAFERFLRRCTDESADA